MQQSTLDRVALINRGAELLKKQGWVQNTYGDVGRGQRHCAVGAVMEAVHEKFGLMWEALPMAAGFTDLTAFTEEAVIADHMEWNEKGPYGLNTTELTAWNDDKGRTVGEVVDKLREIASKIAAEGK